MGRHAVPIAAVVALASAASAATLTVTPDALTYEVGQTIVLNVFGDPEGEKSRDVFGRLFYSAERASHLGSNQQPLTTSFGQNPWTVLGLDAGVDAEGRLFSDAFNQVDGNVDTPGNTLVATVTLLAESPGILGFDWQKDDSEYRLRFFSLDDAPGASVTILPIPEPSTLRLLALGLLLGTAGAARSRRAAG